MDSGSIKELNPLPHQGIRTTDSTLSPVSYIPGPATWLYLNTKKWLTWYNCHSNILCFWPVCDGLWAEEMSFTCSSTVTSPNWVMPWSRVVAFAASVSMESLFGRMWQNLSISNVIELFEYFNKSKVMPLSRVVAFATSVSRAVWPYVTEFEHKQCRWTVRIL